MDTSMYRPRPVAPLRRWSAALVTALFTAVNGLFPHAAEANFWAERKKAAQQMHAAPDEGLAYGGGPSRLTPDQQRLFAQLPRAGQMSMQGAPVADAAGGLSMSAKDAAALPPLDSGSLASGSSWLSTLILPFGSLREIHLSPRGDAPLIIHIQDAHGIEEAQRNIAGLIQSLQENRGVNLVGVEGASGGFPMVEPLRGLARPDVVKNTADAFLADGTLGGAEYAALASPRAPVLWGVEDAADYQANIQAVKEGLRGQKKIDAVLKALSEQARALKAKIYSPELKQFDGRLSAYHAQSESLGDHVRYIMAAPAARGASWRNLSILVEALDAEAALDFRKVEQERLRLVERLAKALPRRALDELVQKSLQHRLGQVPYGKYHAYLRDLCRAHGVVLSDLPQLKGYVDYVLLADDINREGLLKELEARERAVEAKLARTPEQARLAAAARRLGLAEKLAAHQMSPADWAAYSQDRAEILALPAELMALAGEKAGEPLPEALIAPFENFCRLALRRNEHFVMGLLERMKADKTNAAVLVAGGFHSEDLVKRFKKEGASVVLVTPKITEIPKDLNYLDVFSRDPLPLEKMFRGEVISLKHSLPLGAKTADENTLRLGATAKAVEIFKQQGEGRLDPKAEQASLQAVSPAGVTAVVETNDGVASLALSFPTGAEARVVAAQENALAAAAEAADVRLSQAERAQVGDAVVLYDQSTSLSAKARAMMPQILAAARQSRTLAARAAPAAASATDVALNTSLFALPAMIGLSPEAIERVNSENLPDEAALLGWLASLGAKNPLNSAPAQLLLELAPPGLPSVSDAPPAARFMPGPSAPVSAAPARLVTLPGKVPVNILYRDSYPPSNVTVTTAEVHAALAYLGSLLKYLAEKKPDFLLAQAQQFSSKDGVDFKRDTIQSISIDYIASGRHKAAYKFTIVMSNGVSLDVMAGLKTEAGSALPLFEDGELAALEVLQDTSLVPKLGGVLYVEKKGDSFGVSTTLAPPKRDFTTVVFDELIKGRPIGLVHDFRKSEPPDWLAESCLLLLVRIYMQLNPDISKPGTAPDDIHPFNIVQEAGTGRAVMVDLGRQMHFNSLSQYLIGPLLYYSGEKDGSALQSLYREFPAIDWDDVLFNTVQESIKLKHTLDPEDFNEMSHVFKYKRREINFVARRVARFLVNTGRFGMKPTGKLYKLDAPAQAISAATPEQAPAGDRPLGEEDIEDILQNGALVGEPILISSEKNTSDVYRVTLEKGGKQLTSAFKRHNTSYGREHEVATRRVNKLLAGPDLKLKGSDAVVRWPDVPPVVIRRLSGRFGGEIGSANLFVEGREGSPDYFKSTAARRLGGFDFFTGNGDRSANANFIEQADGAIRPFDNGNAFSSSIGMSGFRVRHVPLPEDMAILAAKDERAVRAELDGLVTEGRINAALARRSVQLAFAGMESLLEDLPMDFEIMESFEVEELAALPSEGERIAKAREFLMRAVQSQVSGLAADLSVGAIFEGTAALDDLKEMLTPGGPAFHSVAVSGDADQVAAQIREALAGLPEDRWVALSVRSGLDNGVVHHISVVDRVDALRDRVDRIADGKADIGDHEFVSHVVEDAARSQVHLHSISFGTRERRTLELAGQGKMAQPFRNVWAALARNYAGWTISAIPTDPAVGIAVETTAEGRKRFPFMSPFGMKRASFDERQPVLERYQPVAPAFHSFIMIGRVPAMDDLAKEGFFDGYAVPAPRSALVKAVGTGLLAVVFYVISSPLKAVLGMATAGASPLIGDASRAQPHIEIILTLPQLSVAAALALAALVLWAAIRHAAQRKALAAALLEAELARGQHEAALEALRQQERKAADVLAKIFLVKDSRQVTAQAVKEQADLLLSSEGDRWRILSKLDGLTAQNLAFMKADVSALKAAQKWLAGRPGQAERAQRFGALIDVFENGEPQEFVDKDEGGRVRRRTLRVLPMPVATTESSILFRGRLEGREVIIKKALPSTDKAYAATLRKLLANDAHWLMDLARNPDARRFYPVDIVAYDEENGLLVMEAVAGESLDRTLLKNGPFTQAQALGIGLGFLEALASLPTGLVHHDVKLGNVIFDPASGRVTLLDFGHARMENPEEPIEQSKIPGTYMPPEVFLVPARPFTARQTTDVYTAALTIIRMMSAERPGMMEDVRPLLARLGLPKAVEEVLSTALASDPDARYATPALFLAALRKALEQEGMPVAPAASRESSTVRKSGMWTGAAFLQPLVTDYWNAFVSNGWIFLALAAAAVPGYLVLRGFLARKANLQAAARTLARLYVHKNTGLSKEESDLEVRIDSILSDPEALNKYAAAVEALEEKDAEGKILNAEELDALSQEFASRDLLATQNYLEAAGFQRAAGVISGLYGRVTRSKLYKYKNLQVFIDLLGEGPFFEVHKGLWDDIPVAVKMARRRTEKGSDLSPLTDSKREELQQNELETLRTIRDYVREHNPVAEAFFPVRVLEMVPRRGDLVTEQAKGFDLQAILKKRGGPLPAQTAVRYVSSLLEALENIPPGLVHRDIKPANVVVDEASGALKLVDWALADMEGETAFNGRGLSMGTPEYMAPEVARPDPARRIYTYEIAVHQDLYSAAMVLFELLTKEMAMDLVDWEGWLAADNATRQELLAAKGIPPFLTAFLVKGLSEDPASRFQTAAGMRDELQKALRTFRNTPVSVSMDDGWKKAALLSPPEWFQRTTRRLWAWDNIIVPVAEEYLFRFFVPLGVGVFFPDVAGYALLVSNAVFLVLHLVKHRDSLATDTGRAAFRRVVEVLLIPALISAAAGAVMWPAMSDLALFGRMPMATVGELFVQMWAVHAFGNAVVQPLLRLLGFDAEKASLATAAAAPSARRRAPTSGQLATAVGEDASLPVQAFRREAPETPAETVSLLDTVDASEVLKLHEILMEASPETYGDSFTHLYKGRDNEAEDIRAWWKANAWLPLKDLQVQAPATGTRFGEFMVTDSVSLGEGAFGGVYKARKVGKDGALEGPELVIKTLSTAWKNRALAEVIAALASYRQEGRSLRRLDSFYKEDSPAPAFHAMGEGLPYLVLGFEEGKTLKELTAEDAVGVLKALARLHEAGVIHKDIKPSNFIKTSDGIKVLDLGAAVNLRSLRPEDRRVRPTDFVNTPNYLAPEVDAPNGRVADFSSDSYSAAKMLRNLLPTAVVRRPDVWPVLRLAILGAPDERPTMEEMLAVFQKMPPVWEGKLLGFEPAMVVSHPLEVESMEQLRNFVLHSNQFPEVLSAHPEIKNVRLHIAEEMDLVKGGHVSAAGFQVKIKSLFRGAEDMGAEEALKAFLSEMWYQSPSFEWVNAGDYDELLEAYGFLSKDPQKEDILAVLRGLRDNMLAPEEMREVLDAVPGLYNKVEELQMVEDAVRAAERETGVGKGVLLPAPEWFKQGAARLWVWENLLAPFLEEGFFRMVLPLGLGLLFPDTAGYWLVASNAAFSVLHLLNDKSAPKTGWAAARNVLRLMGLPLLISVAASAVMLPFLSEYPLLARIPLESLGVLFLQVWLIHVMGNAVVQPFLKALGMDVEKASLGGRIGLSAPLSAEERSFKLAVILAEYRANPEKGERLARVLLSDGREEETLSRTPVAMRGLKYFLEWDAEDTVRAWASLRGALAKDLPQPLLERLDGLISGIAQTDVRKGLEGILEGEARRAASLGIPRPFKEISDQALSERYVQGLRAMAAKSGDNSVEAAALSKDVTLEEVQDLHALTEELALRVAAGQLSKRFKMKTVQERLQALKTILSMKRERFMTNSLAGQGWIASLFVSPPLELMLRKFGLESYAAVIGSHVPSWAPLVTALGLAVVTTFMVGLHLWRYRRMGVKKTAWGLWAASQVVFTGILLLPGGDGWMGAGVSTVVHVMVNGLVLLLGRETKDRVSVIFPQVKRPTLSTLLEEKPEEKAPMSTPYARVREELDEQSLPVPEVPESRPEPFITFTEGADFTPSERQAVARDQQELAEITPVYSPAQLLERALSSSHAGWSTDIIIELMASEEGTPDPLVTFGRGPLTLAEAAAVAAEQAAGSSRTGSPLQGGHGRVSFVTRPDGKTVARKTPLDSSNPFQVLASSNEAMHLKEMNAALAPGETEARGRIPSFEGYDEKTHALDMEILPGLDLTTWMKQEGAFSREEGLDILEEMAEGLAAIHGVNVVHGDMKGSSVMYDRASKRVVIIDFGLSGPVGDAGTVFTPAYASPEARRGAPLDPRSDLYSLGVTALRILSGSIWPAGDSPLLAAGVQPWLDKGGYEKRQAGVDQLTDLPAPVRTVLKKLLAPRAEDRYQTAEEMLADLRAARRSSQPPSSPPRSFVALARPIWMSVVTFFFINTVTSRGGATGLADTAPAPTTWQALAAAGAALVVAGLVALGLRWWVRRQRLSHVSPFLPPLPVLTVRPPTPESALTITANGAVVMGATDRVALSDLTGPERRFRMQDKEGLVLILGQLKNVRLPVVRRGNSLMFMIPNRDAVTTGPVATVGRHAANDVPLPQGGHVLDVSVASNRHLRVSLSPARDEVTVTDLGSKNGTYVEGYAAPLPASSEEAAQTLASTQLQENALAIVKFEEALAALGKNSKDMYALLDAIDAGNPLTLINAPFDLAVKQDAEKKVRVLKERLRGLEFGDDLRHEFDLYKDLLKWIRPGAVEGHWLLVDPANLEAAPAGYVSRIEALKGARDRYVVNTALPDANVWPLVPYLRALGGGSKVKDEEQRLPEDLVFARDIIDYFQSLPDDLGRRNIQSLSSTDVATVKHWYQRVRDQATDNDIASRVKDLGYDVPDNARGLWALMIRTYLRKQTDLDVRNRRLGKLSREDADRAFDDYSKNSLKTTEQASGEEAEAMRRPSQLPEAPVSVPTGRGSKRGMAIMAPVALTAAVPVLLAGSRAWASGGPAFNGIGTAGIVLVAAGALGLAMGLMAIARWVRVVALERRQRDAVLARAYASVVGWNTDSVSERQEFELVDKLVALLAEGAAEERLAGLSDQELAALNDLLGDHEQNGSRVEEKRKLSSLIGALIVKNAVARNKTGGVLPPTAGILLASAALSRRASAAARDREPLTVNVYDRTAWLAERKALEVLRITRTYVDAYNALQTLLSIQGLTPAMRRAPEEAVRGQEAALAAMLKEMGLLLEAEDADKAPEDFIWSVLPAYFGERGILMWRVSSTTVPTAGRETRWKMEAGLSEIKEIRALDPALGEAGASRELRLGSLRFNDALERNPQLVHGHLVIPPQAEERMAGELSLAVLSDVAAKGNSFSALDAARRRFAGRRAQSGSDAVSWSGRVLRFRMMEARTKPEPVRAGGETMTAEEIETSGRDYLDATLTMLRGLPPQDRTTLLYKLMWDYRSPAVRLPFAHRAEHALLDFLISYVVDNAGSLDMDLDGETVPEKRAAAAGRLLELTPEQLAAAVTALQEGLARMPDFQLPPTAEESILYEGAYVRLPTDWTVPAVVLGVAAAAAPVAWVVGRRMALRAARLRELKTELRTQAGVPEALLSGAAKALLEGAGAAQDWLRKQEASGPRMAWEELDALRTTALKKAEGDVARRPVFRGPTRFFRSLAARLGRRAAAEEAPQTPEPEAVTPRPSDAPPEAWQVRLGKSSRLVQFAPAVHGSLTLSADRAERLAALQDGLRMMQRSRSLEDRDDQTASFGRYLVSYAFAVDAKGRRVFTVYAVRERDETPVPPAKSNVLRDAGKLAEISRLLDEGVPMVVTPVAPRATPPAPAVRNEAETPSNVGASETPAARRVARRRASPVPAARVTPLKPGQLQPVSAGWGGSPYAFRFSAALEEDLRETSDGNDRLDALKTKLSNMGPINVGQLGRNMVLERPFTVEGTAYEGVSVVVFSGHTLFVAPSADKDVQEFLLLGILNSTEVTGSEARRRGMAEELAAKAVFLDQAKAEALAEEIWGKEAVLTFSFTSKALSILSVVLAVLVQSSLGHAAAAGEVFGEAPFWSPDMLISAALALAALLPVAVHVVVARSASGSLWKAFSRPVAPTVAAAPAVAPSTVTDEALERALSALSPAERSLAEALFQADPRPFNTLDPRNNFVAPADRPGAVKALSSALKNPAGVDAAALRTGVTPAAALSATGLPKDGLFMFLADGFAAVEGTREWNEFLNLLAGLSRLPAEDRPGVILTETDGESARALLAHPALAPFRDQILIAPAELRGAQVDVRRTVDKAVPALAGRKVQPVALDAAALYADGDNVLPPLALRDLVKRIGDELRKMVFAATQA